MNAYRVKALMNILQESAKNKAESIKYYEENGTLRGFKGSTLPLTA